MDECWFHIRCLFPEEAIMECYNKRFWFYQLIIPSPKKTILNTLYVFILNQVTCLSWIFSIIGEKYSRWFTLLLCINLRLNRNKHCSGAVVFCFRLYSLFIFSYLDFMGGIKKETHCSFHESNNIPLDLI